MKYVVKLKAEFVVKTEIAFTRDEIKELAFEAIQKGKVDWDNLKMDVRGPIIPEDDI